jgi:hypothetical protein
MPARAAPRSSFEPDIRRDLRHASGDAASFTTRLENLRQDIVTREDTSGEKFIIVLDGEPVSNRGIAGELLIRRATKLKHHMGEDTRP